MIFLFPVVAIGHLCSGGSIDGPLSFPLETALENTGGATGDSRVASGNSKGQTFAFNGGAGLTSAIFQVHSVSDGNGSLTARLYANGGNGLPTGSALDSVTDVFPGLSAGEYFEINFNSPKVLPAGSYSIVLETDDLDFKVRLRSDDGYGAGQLIRKNGSTGNAWASGSSGGIDFVFGLLGTVYPEPEPELEPIRPAASSGPNVIFILVDDMGWTDHSVSVMASGHQSDYYQTPTLETLASQGVSFTSAYAQPNCAPTRAALMSGQYAPRSGNGVYNVWSLDRSGGGYTTYTEVVDQEDEFIGGDEATVTMAEAMWNGGYVTAHFGKYHVGSGDENNDTHPLNQGLDYNYGGNTNGNPGSFWSDGSKFGSKVGPELDPYAGDYTTDYINTVLLPLANGNDPSGLAGTRKHLTDAMGDAFIDFMDTHRAGSLSDYPVFVQFHFYAVHTPIQGRSDLVTKYNALSGTNPGHDDAKYAAMVEQTDHAFDLRSEPRW